ncbi:MAG: hypothetical protein KAI24_03705, partial [Planctomycetes bacterium]|nr:hypothetical protein [Planctomycetota bacterium]
MHAPRILTAALLLTCPLQAQLSGTFVINPLLPTGGSTFASFADATSALQTQGVGGPCELLVYDDA